ncbi:hypothetical protein OGH69_00110 [Flavobacterium sp. MFBS3-15]|uniref:hypothetical protein n=1 Tax=Flavobacterium sp. MFBS3-15 TaxID=2989816 RepID=UPI002235BD78|nr:hypothetical protein [Flavobacterium sp. MFBS3-15]MCW4467359.1 hypothetical protein [Flavobacterium sp. MFBS3-15]|tara:strand:- start:173 stop:478 length:306 start_codon:yes stop_codon:yes gene_type:complete
MKKIILSLAALFGTLAVSAQSYPKQPDPTIYEVVKYQKPVTEEPVTEEPAKAENAESKADSVQENTNTGSKSETDTNTAAVKTTATAVAVNEKKSPARKEK